ncbi:hypothetical protein RJT34_03292 [Clitoria ternatea]|uniref:TF-B3 domain-containing protein n=1 Tax=Clitoria ternatea TaxID=43366 RepID=A0AAN9Q2E8_CLITE
MTKGIEILYDEADEKKINNEKPPTTENDDPKAIKKGKSPMVDVDDPKASLDVGGVKPENVAGVGAADRTPRVIRAMMEEGCYTWPIKLRWNECWPWEVHMGDGWRELCVRHKLKIGDTVLIGIPFVNGSVLYFRVL